MKKLKLSFFKNQVKCFAEKDIYPLTKNPYNLFKQVIDPNDSNYKIFYTNYHGVEHKSFVPIKLQDNISCEEFLSIFAKEKSTKQNVLTSKNFEMHKTNTYIPNKYIISGIPTQPRSRDPLTILDQTLDFENLKYRNLTPLMEKDFQSQKFQKFLNTFLKQSSIDKKDINTEAIFNLLKAGQNLKDQMKKYKWVISAVFENINQLINPSDNTKLKKTVLDFNFSHEFSFENNKYNNNLSNLEDIFTVHSKENNFLIPITIFMGKIEDENNNTQCKAVLDNFNILRKLSIWKMDKNPKETVNHNFGIVTNLQHWKFTFYNRPLNYHLETPEDFLVSLDYDLGIEDKYINLDNYCLLLKILKGLMSIKKEATYSLSNEEKL
jgi:hypothetical protein